MLAFHTLSQPLISLYWMLVLVVGGIRSRCQLFFTAVLSVGTRNCAVMDGRSWPVSHCLDDVRSMCSDDDACSLNDESGPARSLSVRDLKQHNSGQQELPLADAYAFVAAEPPTASSKSAYNSIRSSRQQETPASSGVVTASPARPLKWEVRVVLLDTVQPCTVILSSIGYCALELGRMAFCVPSCAPATHALCG